MIFLHKSFFFRIFAANFTNASKFMMDSREFLEQYGIQYTRERAYVVDYLMSHNTHPTADEIYAGLLTKQIAVSRATVYNSLKTLTACGAVFSLQITEGTIRYDINRHRHAHFRQTGSAGPPPRRRDARHGRNRRQSLPPGRRRRSRYQDRMPVMPREATP